MLDREPQTQLVRPLEPAARWLCCSLRRGVQVVVGGCACGDARLMCREPLCAMAQWRALASVHSTSASALCVSTRWGVGAQGVRHRTGSWTVDGKAPAREARCLSGSVGAASRALMVPWWQSDSAAWLHVEKVVHAMWERLMLQLSDIGVVVLDELGVSGRSICTE